MIPLYSILAEQNPYASVPLIALIISVAVLALAFLVGFIKGFRRVGWGGLAWLATCILFVIADGMFRETLTEPFKNMGFTPEIAAFWAALVVAVVCIVIVLTLNGVLTIFLRPKLMYLDELNEEEDNDLAEFGLEYEDDCRDYDYGYAFDPRDRTAFRSGYDNITVGNRIFGGIANLVKWAMILFIAFSFFTFFVGATIASKGPMGIMLSVPIVQTVYDFGVRYTLEFLSIGLVIVLGVKGYGKGFLASLRWVIILVGAIAAAVFSFLLPFTQYSLATEGFMYFLARLVERCVNLFGGAENTMAFMVGRILAGCCLLAFFIVILIILNIILKKCCHMVKAKGPVRVIDGALACVIFLAIGVALVIGVWCVLYTVDYCGIFHTTEIFSKDASLSQGLYKFGETMMKPYIDMFVRK